ncbi:hypothetical protein KAJ83_17935 [Marivibrio halodurans]|uniref:Uncharacterized protein n=1 Tax=Marivibrio halodurans TaxID=2039722 RepID=A0A8J7S267_9PROT|nr:hypothetical protein [Marivibrio halodurans]MBP5858905.1 hypothetical protein [Marivibrio halodurans]
MAELLRDNPLLIAGVVILLAAMLAARGRMRRGPSDTGGRDPAHRRGHVPRPSSERSAARIGRERRRARIQMILALFCILGFTLIAIVNSF